MPLPKRGTPEYEAWRNSPAYEEWRKKTSQVVRSLWQDPNSKLRQKLQSDEYREKKRHFLKAQWQDPNSKIRRACQSEEFRKKVSRGVKAALNDPDIKSRQIEGVKRAWEIPEIREKYLNYLRDPEANQERGKRISEGMRKSSKRIGRPPKDGDKECSG